jgi:hypothetical protein
MGVLISAEVSYNIPELNTEDINYGNETRTP